MTDAEEEVSLEEAIQIALAEHNAGKLNEAEGIYRQVLDYDPAHYDALQLLGQLAYQTARYDEALDLFAQAINVNPEYVTAWFHRGASFHALGKLEEASASYQKVIALRPDLPAAHFNLGVILQEDGQLEAASDYYRRSLLLKPDYAEAANNLGNVLLDMGHLDEAIDHLEQALRLNPLLKPEFNLSQALLACGRLTEGWELFEHRFASVPKRDFPHPIWLGQDLSGKKILIWGEQGIGDQIQHASMFAEIIATAGQSIIECSTKLVPLFSRSFPMAKIAPRTDPPHPVTQEGVDYQCAAGSLARWLRPSLESFPRHEGYLTPDPDRVAHWRRWLAALGPGPKVGFAWRSSKQAGALRHYSTSIHEWGPIFTVPGVHFINLQYDECAQELTTARNCFGIPLYSLPEVNLFDDLAESAALIRALDVVIAPPTSTAILAASVGVPTWTLNYGADWQTHGQPDHPWYPTVRRFPRCWDQTWIETIRLVAAELQKISFVRFRSLTWPGLPHVKSLPEYDFL